MFLAVVGCKGIQTSRFCKGYCHSEVNTVFSIIYGKLHWPLHDNSFIMLL